MILTRISDSIESNGDEDRYSYLLGNGGALVWHELFPNLITKTTITHLEFEENADGSGEEARAEAKAYTENILPMFSKDKDTQLNNYSKKGTKMYIVVNKLNVNLNPSLTSNKGIFV